MIVRTIVVCLETPSSLRELGTQVSAPTVIAICAVSRSRRLSGAGGKLGPDRLFFASRVGAVDVVIEQLDELLDDPIAAERALQLSVYIDRRNRLLKRPRQR